MWAVLPAVFETLNHPPVLVGLLRRQHVQDVLVGAVVQCPERRPLCGVDRLGLGSCPVHDLLHCDGLIVGEVEMRAKPLEVLGVLSIPRVVVRPEPSAIDEDAHDASGGEDDDRQREGESAAA